MIVGPRVYGPNRLGLWIIPNASLTDKLAHVLPRLRGPLPNLTDIFLPPEAQRSHRDQCRNAGFFVNTYDVTHSRKPGDVAAAMLAKRKALGTGAIEIDLEGQAVQPDVPALSNWAKAFVTVVRQTLPNIPIRLNVPPFKGYALPIDLINTDPQVFVIAQAYHGNMDGRLSESDVMLDLLNWGVPQSKAKIMYGVACGPDPNDRHMVLPLPNYKPLTEGSVYSDDLLLGSGLI